MAICRTCQYFHPGMGVWGLCKWASQCLPIHMHTEHAVVRRDTVSTCPVWKQKEADNAEAMQ